MRYLLAFFFFFMYMGDNLGLNISLGPGMSTKNLLLYLILIGIAVNAAVARNRDFDLPSVVVPFGLLIIYSIMTWITVAFVIEDPNYGLRQSFITLKSSWVDQFLTFLIYLYGILYLKDSWWLLKTIIWIVIIGNVITIIDTFNVPNLGILDVPRKAGRFEGFLGQPNAYGQFLVLFIPAAIALFLSQSRKYRAMAGIGVFATILALILSGSRGAYVALIAGAVLSAIFLRQFIPRQTVLKTAVISLAVFGVAVAITFVTGYADIYVGRTLSFEGSAHVITHGRTTIWTTALRPMVEAPLTFLTGFGFFAYESGMFSKSTHNVYLSVLYNLGFIGLTLYVTIFIRILATARSAIALAEGEHRAQLLALVFGLFSFIVAIFFSEYQSSGYLLWAYLGVGMRIAMQTIPKQRLVTEMSGKLTTGPLIADRRSGVSPRHYSSMR